MRGGVDLVFTAECLSYIENWRQQLQLIAEKAKYLMVCLYIPEDPIGYVKSPEVLEEEVSKDFDILESVRLTKSRFTVLFAQSKGVHGI